MVEMNETRILIVDDDEVVRNSLHEFTSISGYYALMASSSEEALELLKDHPMHVVVADIILPNMDGFQLTEVIKNTYDKTEVIIMTEHTMDYSYEEVIAKGASDLIFKPVVDFQNKLTEKF